MEVYLIKGAQLFLSLSILIVLHEFGHFLPARAFKIRVEKFFLFFDVKFALFRKKIGETVYGIGWLPLGGYVKIAGMIDESMDKEQMAQPPKPWEFRSKPAWQRLIVMVGGVTVNVIVAFLIYIMIIFFYGQQYSTPEDMKYGFGVSPTMERYGFEQGDQVLAVNGEPLFDVLDINTYLMMRDVNTVTVEHQNGSTETIKLPETIGDELFSAGDFPPFTLDRYPVQLDSVAAGGPADQAGLQVTDALVAINGTPITYRSDINQALRQSGEQTTTTLEIRREGTPMTLEVQREVGGPLGIFTTSRDQDFIERQTKTYSFGESISEGISYGYWTLRDYVAQFRYVFTKKGATQVGGFGAIAGLFPASWDWVEFWHSTAFISIILAFMNILPIPALDGGHVMFLLYEMISGRKPNEKFMEYATIAGFVLILSLVLFANGNDIYRAIFG
ncbi:RIP metalloprotease RseP [Croceiramulus getboli]|nr:RIP metalloprotease RseP [Flavobacteriaceae bacterium YJPT1-3]